jgi:hypothetical protein
MKILVDFLVILQENSVIKDNKSRSETSNFKKISSYGMQSVWSLYRAQGFFLENQPILHAIIEWCHKTPTKCIFRDGNISVNDKNGFHFGFFQRRN